jgi:hypothetical protein
VADDEDVKQWIATTPDGGELLVTLYDDGASPTDVTVAPRLDGTRWGAPYPARRLP